MFIDGFLNIFFIIELKAPKETTAEKRTGMLYKSIIYFHCYLTYYCILLINIPDNKVTNSSLFLCINIWYI